MRVVIAAGAVLIALAGCSTVGPPPEPTPITIPTITLPDGHGTDSSNTGAVQPATGHDPRCVDVTGGWNAEPETDPAMSPAELFNSRVGKHPCFERLVLDVNGPQPVGYDLRYVPVVTEDGSGHPVPVAGGAALQLVVRAPAQGTGTDGHQPGVIFAPAGAQLHTPGALARWSCLREVRSAGSFEGQTTLAVGVRETLPFALTTWSDADQVTHIVVDLACP